MANVADVVSASADQFFTNTEDEIRRQVKTMNHATRFWLGVKFHRLNANDFEANAIIAGNYSKSQVCAFIQIKRYIFDGFISTLNETDSVRELMETFKYLSPVELHPRRYEEYFKKYAENYEDLKSGGIFRLKPLLQLPCKGK